MIYLEKHSAWTIVERLTKRNQYLIFIYATIQLYHQHTCQNIQFTNTTALSSSKKNMTQEPWIGKFSMYKTFNPSLKSEDITIAEATIQACYNCKFENHTMSRQKMCPMTLTTYPIPMILVTTTSFSYWVAKYRQISLAHKCTRAM